MEENQFDKLEELVATARDEGEKFYDKGNAAAGTRARKALQEIRVLVQEIRVNIQNQKNEG